MAIQIALVEDGPGSYRSTFASTRGELSGRVTVGIEGPPDRRSYEDPVLQPHGALEKCASLMPVRLNGSIIAPRLSYSLPDTGIPDASLSRISDLHALRMPYGLRSKSFRRSSWSVPTSKLMNRGIKAPKSVVCTRAPTIPLHEGVLVRSDDRAISQRDRCVQQTVCADGHRPNATGGSLSDRDR